MSYREKTCPTCGTKHRKKGQYCSRSCGNSRKHTDDHKLHLSKVMSERLQNNEDAAADNADYLRQAQKAAKGIVTDPVPPQTENRWIDDHHQVIDGDYWVDDGY